MYNITDDVLVPKKPAYITPGIHNVKLSEAVLKISKNDRPFFVYVYTNDEGQRVSKTEWQVNLPDNFDTLDPAKKKRYEAVVNAQKERIMKVASLFVPIEELKGNFNTFSDMCNFVAAKINATNFKDVLLRVKLTYDKDGWITTPTYAHSEWIERVDLVPKLEDSKITIVEGKDVMVRPPLKKDNTETKKTSPLIEDESEVAEPVGESNGAVKDDLPF